MDNERKDLGWCQGTSYALLEHSNWWTQEGVLHHGQIVGLSHISHYLKGRKSNCLTFSEVGQGQGLFKVDGQIV